MERIKMKKKHIYNLILIAFLIVSGTGIRAGTVSLDTSFNGTGYQIQGFGATGGIAEGIVVQADGRIVIGGWTTENFGPIDFGAIRFGANGILDNSFSGDGKVTTNLSPFDTARSVLLQPDGKILLCGERYSGNTNNDFAISRYLPDGTLDNSFDGNGIATPIVSGFSDEYSYDALLQPDGKIVMVGTTAPTTTIGENVPTDIAVMRLNTDGSLDTTFNGSGILIARFNNVNEAATAVVLQPDGKIVIGGFLNNTIRNDFLLMRFTAGGLLDTSFGTNGLVITPINGLNSAISSLALQSDGKILAGGSVTGGSAIVRYNSDGSIDNTFSNSGIASTTMSISKLMLKPDGKIIAAGTLNSRITVSRFNANGSIDTNFNGTGIFSASGISSSCRGYSSAIQNDDKIVISGTCYSNTLGLDSMAVIRIKETVRRIPFDFDGDGKTDLSIYRPAAGEWWVNRSSNSVTFAAQFGVSTDKIVPGDYTGDGKTDIAVWRPSSGEWLILRSEDSGYFTIPFGASGDVPAPADYDGDGKTDAAVFRPSTNTWFILNSSGIGVSIVTFGAAGDKPVAADYDGDGKTDIAIFRPGDGSWWYLRSSDGQFRVFRFGVETDKPVQSDYTGDGKADIAVFRPTTGEWFILRSEDSNYYSIRFGTNGDVAVPGDYDGDGKTDAGVFRPSNSTWYVNQTSSGVLITTFGITNDLPVPNAFVP